MLHHTHFSIFPNNLLPRLKRHLKGDVTKEWKIPQKGYWNNVSNQRSFLDDLAKKLNITDPSGWYKLTKQNFEDHCGAGLLQMYNNSPSKLITTLYPEYR